MEESCHGLASSTVGDWITQISIAMGSTAGIRFPAGARDLSFHSVQNLLWVPASLQFNRYLSFFRYVKVTTQLHRVPRSRITGLGGIVLN
jgi:hypothetical protein